DQSQVIWPAVARYCHKAAGQPGKSEAVLHSGRQLVGRKPRQGQFTMVEMDSVVVERGGATVAEAASPAPIIKQGRGAIELRGLTKRYGEETVFNAVAASIAPGEFFSLLGPSGSGKTTTLMMVAGFVHPDEGAILLDGENIAAMPPQKRGFGMVFQNY